MRKAARFISGILCLVLLSIALSAGEAEVVFSGADGGGKRIALTFDDGPHATRTPEILDLLSEHGVKATFFVVGTNVSRFPDLVRRERAEGHEIGNHTFDHARLSCCSESEISDEISGAEDLLVETVGVLPTLFRPPEGAYSEKVLQVAQTMDYRVILWTVDTRDWAGTGTEEIVANVKEHVRDGSIILFHDFAGPKTHTLEALRILIPELLNEGYTFVTVSELLDDFQ